MEKLGSWEISRTKAKWSENFESVMIWLCDEIKPFIAGWCTVFGWNGLLQLGASTGKNPLVNKDRLHLLPFITSYDGKLGTVKTLYDLKDSTFRISGREEVINWQLVGDENDDFNIVIYW